ncbi:MAG: hypothetical protein ACI9TK_000706 [Flavobacteriaceae bacterium]|jgi:hypothetical protein
MIRSTHSVILLMSFFLAQGQYTDQINSNRPGLSIGAFAVGKNVVQAEAGFAFRRYSHSGYNNSTFNGGIGFLSIRWGFIKETLELTYEGQFLIGRLISKIPTTPIIIPKKGFIKNFIGVKYLLYDPFKRERKANTYSWKANNGFKLRDLLPAVSLTLGSNISFEKNNPFPFNNVFGNIYRPIFFQNLNIPQDKEPFAHIRGTLVTQSHFFGTWVFVTNLTYDRYLSKYPEKSYILTLTHTLDPLWSVYFEHQGIKSDLYSDGLFRLGTAYLFSNDIQFEGTIGSSLKTTPHQLSVNIGVSYRLDFHKDFKSSAELEFKKLKKEEKKLKKSLKKNNKKERKRNRKARN